jgi:ribonuclease P protein component
MSAGSPASLELPRDRRIKHRRDFQRAKAQGRRLAQGCLVLNWIPRGTESSSRLGVITAKAIGNAVARSRARRLLRECFRQHQQKFPSSLDLILVARASITGKSLDQVKKDFITAMGRAGLLRDSSGADSRPRE